MTQPLKACRIALVAALAAGLYPPAAAFALSDLPKKVRTACTGDARKLCPKNKVGSEELRYCMEANSKSLSSGCVRALEDEGVVPRGYLRKT